MSFLDTSIYNQELPLAKSSENKSQQIKLKSSQVIAIATGMKKADVL